MGKREGAVSVLVLTTDLAAERFGVARSTIITHCQPGRKLAPFARKVGRDWLLTVPTGASVDWYREVIGPARGRAGNRQAD